MSKKKKIKKKKRIIKIIRRFWFKPSFPFNPFTTIPLLITSRFYRIIIIAHSRVASNRGETFHQKKKKKKKKNQINKQKKSYKVTLLLY